MENNKKETNLVVAGLKFSKFEIGEAAGNEKNTRLAAGLIAFSVILDAVIAYFKGNSGSSGLARMGFAGFNAAFAEMGSALIGTFLSAFIMAYVLRIFKVKPSYAGILRVYAAAIIWTILGAVLGLILPGEFALAGVLFWLAYNFSLMFGLTGYTKIKIWQSFLGIVITFAIIFGIVILYGTVVKSILG